ncbi:hypothetical protein FN846DRAFT_937085 [Sphaerosporella brunnea]|uniref:Bms1-type G domain-containing protein n=1 Tax=Sphaerosporella brunnea TaxID=1250544 RepID=A0A5J5F3V6_9PEZI|nr:hypothetical protein FN846DRAFT_937085 [Sphaerosporella brunnea]
MVSASSGQHHHRSTTKASNKSFKSRHATKSSLKAKNKGKVDDAGAIARKNQHQQVMSKIERRNKARQLQLTKKKDFETDSRIFRGKDAAPRIVAVVPLCGNVSSAAAVRSLLRSLDIEEEVPEYGICTTWVERFKQKIQWIVLRREMLAVLDGCKVADFVLLTLSATEQVDPFGESLIRAIEAQGVSNTHTLVQHLETVEPAKARPDVKKSLHSYISHFFPTTLKVHETESAQEAPNLIRSLCSSTPKGVHWRDDRSYLVAEEVWFEDEMLVVGGVVRGKGLKADRLVHIQGFGDFQIDKICAHPSSRRSRPAASNADAMAVDEEEEIGALEVLDAPTSDRESMQDISDAVSEAPETMSESRKGVLLDDHHYFDEDDDTVNKAYEMPKNVPAGTSKYQSAWFIDGEDYGSDVGGDTEDEDEDMDIDPEAPRPEDGMEGLAGPTAPTVAGTVYGDDAKSEMFLDPSPDQEFAQIAAFRNRQKELEEDREFPDEIELPPNVLARERLARYRGLKSLRTSKWDTSEDRPWQPEDWEHLARIQDYRGSKNRCINEALAGGVAPGTKVLVYLCNGSAEIAEAFRPERPMVLWGLLRHEHKQAVVNVALTASTDYEGEPVKSKDEIILQIGPRRLHVNPIFSVAGGTGANNVAKFERFLIPGRTSVATFVGPVTWGPVPVVAWKRGDGETDWELVGQGSFLNVDRERVVAKRIVLTGHPYKIHKRMVTVRYMFFNQEDVNWFKAIPLYTRRGRSGFIKESLGTHGYFKATFDGRINPQDAVAISLYKRVFPRGSTEFAE